MTEEQNYENKWTFAFNECYGWFYDIYEIEEDAIEDAIKEAENEEEESVYIGRTTPAYKLITHQIHISDLLDEIEEWSGEIVFEGSIKERIPKKEREEAEEQINEILRNLIKKHCGFMVPEFYILDIKTKEKRDY
jgi:hypothetical protein